MALLPVLDAHHHLWDLSVREQPWLSTHPDLAPLRRDFGLADLAPLAAAAGVTGTVIVQTVTEPGETPEMLALAAGGSLVTAVVGWTDLTAPGVADDLAALRARPDAGRLAGIRHPVLMEPDPDWLTRPDVLRGLAAVAAAGLTYDVVVQPGQLPAAGRAAAEVGDLLFVLDHLGNVEVEPQVDEQWAAAFRRFAALPNTVAKLSGIFAEPPPPGAAGPGDVGYLRPYYEIALECFGPERLMFGSDWPVSSLGVPYGDIVVAARTLTRDLSQPEQEAIFGATARRVYQIPADHWPHRARPAGTGRGGGGGLRYEGGHSGLGGVAGRSGWAGHGGGATGRPTEAGRRVGSGSGVGTGGSRSGPGQCGQGL